MSKTNYNIITDYAYSIEELQELFDDTKHNSSTNSCMSLSKYSSILLLTTATMMGGVPNNNIIKPEINVMISDTNFKVDEYQNSLSNFDEYDNLFCIDGNKRKCIETILSFKSLNQSWDGYGAYPLQIPSASNAISILNSIESSNEQFIDPDDIFPNPNGTVSILWENNYEERVSLEIGNSNISYYTQFKNSKPEFFNEVEVNTYTIEMLTGKIKALF